MGSLSRENHMSIQEALEDYDRVHYFQGTTAALVRAIHEDGIDIRSYFPWSTVSLLYFESPHWKPNSTADGV